MIGKYDKDFLPPDRPVPTPLNAHLAEGLRTALSASEVTSGRRGVAESQICGGAQPERTEREKEREKERERER